MREENIIVVMKPLRELISGMSNWTLEFKSAMNEFPMVVLFNRMRSVEITNDSPTSPFVMVSREPSNKELVLEFSSAFRTVQEFLASSETRMSTVSRKFYRSKKKS